MSESYETACCIVGAGPAGAVLALLLSRQGIATTLLEAHQDFDREFRGDTIHPSVSFPLSEARVGRVIGWEFGSTGPESAGKAYT